MKCILIGGGMVAKAHLLALRDNTCGIRLAGLMGQTPERAKVLALGAEADTGHSVVALHEIEQVAAEKPDFAILITPPNARTSYCSALSNAGIPVLTEKPIERNFDAASQIVEMFERQTLPLGVVFQHRSRAASKRLKSMLSDGSLGDIVHVELRVPWWRDQAYYDAPGRGSYERDGGGVMISQAIHTLDLATWLVGPVRELQAQMRTSPLHKLEAEDIAGALLTFDNGASGVLSATTCAYPGAAESIAITTTAAQVHLQGDQLTIDEHGKDRVVHDGGASETGGGADPMAFTHAWHQNVLENFANALTTGNEPLACGRSALHVHALIASMERASISQRIETVPV